LDLAARNQSKKPSPNPTMNLMKRRQFLTHSAVFAGAVAGSRALAADDSAASMPKLPVPPQAAELNLCLQWHAIPGGSIPAKLDFMEQNGFAAIEVPSGEGLLQLADPLAKALEGRKLKISTACGPSNFAWADAAKRQHQVDILKPVIEKLGMLKGVGLIVCPARQDPELPFPELRRDFIENTGRQLAEHAVKHDTTIALEPLRRQETPFLRQVADGAMMAREIGAGATVIGDFWHMHFEETCQMGSLISAGPLLSHIHIASLRRRMVPGLDGDADRYVDGFRALKLLGYRGAVSFEGGFPKDAPEETRIQLLREMCTLLRAQWAEA
jgi:sugar phosphate isomerase/epimerase